MFGGLRKLLGIPEAVANGVKQAGNQAVAATNQLIPGDSKNYANTIAASKAAPRPNFTEQTQVPTQLPKVNPFTNAPIGPTGATGEIYSYGKNAPLMYKPQGNYSDFIPEYALPYDEEALQYKKPLQQILTNRGY